ncbi:hypothetical protein PP713_13955 [Mycobacterium sp. CSUR Q5927]|nr:hypothetical protein [Mycobacterium sp. CSUR Q5927]
MDDLDELQRELFVIFDHDTDEAFVRTYIRNSNVIKVPNMLKSARRSAELVASNAIKPFLAAELRATGNPDCIAVAEKIDPSSTPPEPFEKTSGTLSEPFSNPSDSNPSRTLSEGSGVGTGVGVSHFGRNLGGEGRRPRCSKHEENHDGPCRACQRRRKWDEDHAEDELQRKRADRQALINAVKECPECDEFGRTVNDEGDITGFCSRHPRLKDVANA